VTLSTHVLDATTGRPAAGLAVFLEVYQEDPGWTRQHLGITDGDGRMRLDGGQYPGMYRFTFLTGDYFSSSGVPAFFPEVTITFSVSSAAEHYHVPLLLSPFAYSTYRGS
jgi:5-hydroxyisourate hydrolase